MNWTRIDQLLAQCLSGPGTMAGVPAVMPNDYREVLQRRNGTEGPVGSEQYVMLWPVESLDEFNQGYAVQEYVPGVFLIGTDGGNTGFGVTAEGLYVSVPLIGMDPKYVEVLGASFEEFLERLAKDSSD